MRNKRLRWMLSGAMVGVIIAGVGWGIGNFYLVVAGALVLAGAVSYLSLPMPAIL
jgi:hypothetical protein